MRLLVLSAAARRRVSWGPRSLPCLMPPVRAARMRAWRLGKAGGRRLATTSSESSWWNFDRMRVPAAIISGFCATISSEKNFTVSNDQTTVTRYLCHRGSRRRKSVPDCGASRRRRQWLFLRSFSVLARLWIPDEHSRGMCAVGCDTKSSLV